VQVIHGSIIGRWEGGGVGAWTGRGVGGLRGLKAPFSTGDCRGRRRDLPSQELGRLKRETAKVPGRFSVERVN